MIRNTFSNRDRVLPLYFPLVLLSMLEDRGLSLSDLLSRTGIDEQDLGNADYKINFEQLKQLLSNAMQWSNNAHLGWEFGARIDLSALGMPGYAALSSETFKQALETLEQYFKIRDPIYQLAFTMPTEPAEPVVLEISEALDFGELRYFLLSSMVSGAASVLSALAGTKPVILRAALACATPSDWAGTCLHIDYPVRFDADATRLVLDRSVLVRKMPNADAQTAHMTREICDQLLASIKEQVGIVHQMKSYLLACRDRYPSLDEAASHFCVSPRSLRRALAASDTSYQKVLDEVRKQVALQLLTQTTIPIKRIAIQMGFDDASNFSRAFKRWTGDAPARYRTR